MRLLETRPAFPFPPAQSGSLEFSSRDLPGEREGRDLKKPGGQMFQGNTNEGATNQEGWERGPWVPRDSQGDS